MEHLFLKSKDSTRLHVTRHDPEGDARGDILISHGLAEHQARYDLVTSFLNKRGWRVWFLELRGHGDSEGTRGHVDSWDLYHQDITALLVHVAAPAFILAHSMGGLVALGKALDKRQPALIRGIVLTNPLLGVAVRAPTWKTSLAGMLSKILPKLPIGNELEPSLLCHDTDIVEAYRKDPKVFKTVTPRWFTEMNKELARVMESAPEGRVPLFMITSEQDRICNPAEARRFTQAWGGPKEHLHLPDLYHEILNEPGKKHEVMEHIGSWLDLQLQTPSMKGTEK